MYHNKPHYLSLALAFALALASINLGAQELETPSRVVAEIHFEDAKLTFIDETFDGEFGFGILEQGAINLAPFYEAGATALEIFLALAPEDTEVPDLLYRAHELARRFNPSVPETPRGKLYIGGAAKALIYHAFSQDTGNCWGWGDVPAYDPNIGNTPDDDMNGHRSNRARQEFIDWSGIDGAGLELFMGAESEQDAEGEGIVYYPTPFGHERAFAICVTHAEISPTQDPFDCSLTFSPYYNTIDYQIRLWGKRQSGDWWSSDAEHLTAYGQGARYRSSSNDLRKYRLALVDNSEVSIICKEKYEVFWRSFEVTNPWIAMP